MHLYILFLDLQNAAPCCKQGQNTIMPPHSHFAYIILALKIKFICLLVYLSHQALLFECKIFSLFTYNPDNQKNAKNIKYKSWCVIQRACYVIWTVHIVCLNRTVAYCLCEQLYRIIIKKKTTNQPKKLLKHKKYPLNISAVIFVFLNCWLMYKTSG